MKKSPPFFSMLFLLVFLSLTFTCSRKTTVAIEQSTVADYTYSWDKLRAYPVNYGRTDDLHFFDPMHGFVINSEGYLVYTEDGGANWEIIYEDPGTFFRCITFKNRMEGWIGNIGQDDVYLPSKDSIPLYETKDGGVTWQPVKLIGPQPKGLCGLQKVNDQVVVGCGRVRGPSFFIKTTDGGQSWYSYDLNHVAGSLIAPYFFDEQHGLLIGGTTTDKKECQSLVLETFDGGITWDTLYMSEQKGEYCWKFSFPTEEIGFISIQRNSKRGRFYHLQTNDGGRSWREVEHTQDPYYVQGVGFVNSQVGWLGGTKGETYETTDGGKTWSSRDDIGDGFNNFQTFGDSLIYGVGFGVFKSKRVAKPKM